MLPKRIGADHGTGPFADPTPLGLLGLAIGCAALVPIAFGARLTPAGLKTAAIFCLFFGAGCQAIAGMLNLANKNLLGGTLFTTFTFQWLINWWALDSLAKGNVPDQGIVFATEVLSLVIFIVLTYAFGLYSTLLFVFLLDIDVLYVAKVINGIAGTRALDPLIAWCTVALGAIAVWIAFAILVNPAAGRAVFKMPGPLFRARPRPAFDLSHRQAIFAALYARWQAEAFRPLPLAELEGQVSARLGGRSLLAELHYLAERGAVALTLSAGEPGAVAAARLTAAGIDTYERAALGKDAV